MENRGGGGGGGRASQGIKSSGSPGGQNLKINL